MMQFRDLPLGRSPWRPLNWTNGSFQDSLTSQSVGLSAYVETDVLSPHSTFNAPNPTRIAGVKIEWTDNLNDHLKPKGHNTTVIIFHHPSFLGIQRQDSHEGITLHRDLFPAGFIEEPLQTLALIFPQDGRETQIWLEKIRSDSHTPTLDPKAVRCGRLKSDGQHRKDFTFLRDRLTILKQVFDEAEPNTIDPTVMV
ncbi:conserved hypothetical protein [Talaromyces marneffei ATCC 18224]|uniref:Uncharacterized protein n=1 Tax=Talaromyces marneffei (strain ATCC 18224 / CBS 334.59 / QM 7333) TaxID=441960 RepID=B6QDD9_TALMQ|nr:conserved hypothetical protein [Talaromyces marneffei ATCC 18224]